jgi:uncharacterized protein YebE (UPF0316 family)
VVVLVAVLAAGRVVADVAAEEEIAVDAVAVVVVVEEPDTPDAVLDSATVVTAWVAVVGKAVPAPTPTAPHCTRSAVSATNWSSCRDS